MSWMDVNESEHGGESEGAHSAYQDGGIGASRDEGVWKVDVS